MAEEERKTKAERREEKRQRRQEEEAAREDEARRNRLRNGAVALTLVLVLGGLAFLALGNQTPDLEGAITVSQADVDEARTSSGCEVLDVQELPTREHVEPGTAPPAEALYTNGRPTASGDHYTTPGPVFNGVRDQQLDERATTHNMEHGSVIVWYDPEQVDGDAVAEMDDMVATLNEAGFASDQGRAGIFASPYTDPGIDSGKAIAVRSWGQGMDCDSFDIDYVRGWIAENFGVRGPAPEAGIGQYPEGVLEIAADGEGSDATTGDEPTTDPEPSDGDTTGEE